MERLKLSAFKYQVSRTCVLSKMVNKVNPIKLREKSLTC